MEIHSSSLAYIPNGYQPNNTKKQEIESVAKETQSLSLVKQIEKPFESESFQQLTTFIESQHSVPTNSRTARAINAYVQESIKPIKAQRSVFISNIDLLA